MATSFLEPLAIFLDGWLTRRSGDVDIPGFVVSIGLAKSIIFSRAYGFLDTTKQHPLSPWHMFPIASQSKMITATAIMRLVEDGRIQLHDRAETYVPWLREHPDPAFCHVTIQQLLWHGAGIIRDGYNADYWQLASPFPDDVTLRQLVFASRVSSAASRKIKYSNIGYALLGQIIQAVTGFSYEAFCHELILEPLNLQSIKLTPQQGFCLTPGNTRRIAGRRIITPAYIATGTLNSATGWYASADDMVRFLLIHSAPLDRPLQVATKHMMHNGLRSHWLPPQLRGSYGLGFQMYRLGDYIVCGHAGAAIGHRTFSFFHPPSGLVVAVMANARDAPIQHMGHGILDICLRFLQAQHELVPPEHNPFAIVLANLTSTVQIVPVGHRLFALFPDTWSPFSGAEELHRIGPTTLQVIRANNLAAEGELVQYAFDAHRNVQSVNYTGVTMLPEHLHHAWLRTHTYDANN